MLQKQVHFLFKKHAYIIAVLVSLSPLLQKSLTKREELCDLRSVLFIVWVDEACDESNRMLKTLCDYSFVFYQELNFWLRIKLEIVYFNILRRHEMLLGPVLFFFWAFDF